MIAFGALAGNEEEGEGEGERRESRLSRGWKCSDEG